EEGYIGLSAERGARLGSLLRQARARGIMPGYVEKLLAAFAQRLEARDLRLADAIPASSLKPLASTPVEPLSVRELEVLRLVAPGQSHPTIRATPILPQGNR